MIVDKEGDIWTSTASAMCHGVNTQGVMGAGLAAQVRERYPAMYEEYAEACKNGRFLVGDISSFTPPEDNNFWAIYNLASQDLPGPHASYTLAIFALDKAIEDLMGLWEVGLIQDPVSLAVPQLGCGIGGLDWDIMRQMIVDLDAALAVGDRLPTPLTLELWTYRPTTPEGQASEILRQLNAAKREELAEEGAHGL